MADVYVNALTTISTEPTTTDSLVAVNRNTNEGKIIDYNLLADTILNKITSKQYSGLNTTSKLLVGAINELDSDVSALDSLSEIELTAPSQSNYSQSVAFKAYSFGKMVFVCGVLGCTTPYTTSPGISFLTGLPAPATASTVLMTFPNTPLNSDVSRIRITIGTNGWLYARYGTAGHIYDVVFVYCKA